MNRSLVRAQRAARATRGVERSLARKANVAALVSDRLALERRRAFEAGSRADRAADLVRQRREALEDATAALDAARAGVATTAMAPGSLFGSASFGDGYVFPVGGGQGPVSVGHHHHDYPAADIAAPSGAPAVRPGGRRRRRRVAARRRQLRDRLKLLAADGRTWTYCHLSFLEPSVTAGVFLSAGTPVGLVGSTGHSTGPHLHLQTSPVLTYPQEESWFQSFAGTAFSGRTKAGHQHLPVAQFASAPVFEVVQKPVFEVVTAETAPADDVVEFTLDHDRSMRSDAHGGLKGNPSPNLPKK